MVSIEEIKSYHNKEDDDKLTFRIKLLRFTGAYIAKLLLYTPITGNQVSFLMGVLSVIIGVLFSFGEFWYSIIAFIVLLLQLNLDAVDGLIARYRKAASIRGPFVDLVVHSVTGPLIFFGLAVGVFRNTNNLIFLIFGMLAGLFSYLEASVQYLKHQVVIMKLMDYANGEKLGELEGKELEIRSTEADKSERFIFWKKIVRKLLSYLSFLYIPLILFPAIIFNFTQWLLVFYGIALPIKWLVNLIYEFKMDYKYLEYLFKPYKPK